MRINLDSLLVLDAIERNGSFALAAEELNRVPSAITYTINQLESTLGIEVFDRSGYRAKLTPAGVEFLKEGRPILEQAKMLEQKVRASVGLGIPNITIAYDGAIDFDIMTQFLHLIYDEYPEISINLLTEILNGNKDALLSGTADLVIGAFVELPTESIYNYELLGTSEFIFVVAPDHPLASVQEPLTYKAIASHRIVVVGDTAKNIPKASSGYPPDFQYLRVSSMENKIDAHITGLGVGFLPAARAGSYIEAGMLVPKAVDRPKANSNYYLAWRVDRMYGAIEKVKEIILTHKTVLFG